jgi:hypothetical protein
VPPGQCHPGGSASELGLDQLRDNGFEVTVLTVDEDGPRFAGRAGTDSCAAGGKTILGDLRTVPMPPRSFDIARTSPDAHDEVLYVIRKPEDRFARVV